MKAYRIPWSESLLISGYFLLGDSLNTTVTVLATLQNELAGYDPITLTYLLLVGIGTQAMGIYGFWTIQKRFRLSTKTSTWTQRFGFHHLWEMYLYQAIYGLFVCPVSNAKDNKRMQQR
ncbi:uncharacterized protein KY384_005331 [Bacidia gigantensis]|uniref:uncharacterized protein n=1 Tax=Bacidia gigantensis TaxID=2732470 RepID=UPI001D04117B|nr:uncharacterized protein KY384_005331 [Bacidia gigantensis]KAG8529850.1 hypothetical protein KY384_005331 [Bacidia gigantensis]